MLVALIPARSGSKGIIDKNIKLFCGKPLIQWTIEAALNSSSIDRVIVSTDDKKYASLSQKLGAEVPFIRPAELAKDNSPSISFILHALEELPDANELLLLQPTSPLRTTEDIESLITFWKSTPRESIISITPAEVHPSWMFALNQDSTLKPLSANKKAFRRQDLPNTYVINGALYLATRDFLVREKSFFSKNTLGYLIPKERSIDIDTELDWFYAESLMKKNINKN